MFSIDEDAMFGVDEDTAFGIDEDTTFGVDCGCDLNNSCVDQWQPGHCVLLMCWERPWGVKNLLQP